MKLFKKVLSAALTVMMLSALIPSISAFAEGEYTDQADIWLYPTVNSSTQVVDGTNSTVYRNGDTGRYLSGRKVNDITIDDITIYETMNVPDDYYIIRNGLATSYAKQTGIEYQPKLSDTEHPYYELYVDMIDHSNSTAVDLTLEVVTKDGTYTTTLKALESADGWGQETRYMGVVKLSNPETDKIGIWLPLDQTYDNTKYFSVGGIKLKQLAATDIKWFYPTVGTHGTTNNVIISNTSDDNNATVWSKGVSGSYLGSRVIVDDIEVLGAPEGFTHIVRQALTDEYTLPTRIEYNPKLEDTTNPYYAVYVQRIAHINTNDVALEMAIYGDDGIYSKEIPALEDAASGWNRDMYYVGNVKLSNPDTNQIQILLPLDKAYQNTTTPDDYFSFGTVMLVQLDGTPAELMTPVKPESKWVVPFPDNHNNKISRLEVGGDIIKYGWSRPVNNSVASGLFVPNDDFSADAKAEDNTVTLQYENTHYIASANATDLGSGKDGVVSAETGMIYRTTCDDEENPYWTVYYEKVVGAEGTNLDNLHIRVYDDNGKYFYNIDNTKTSDNSSVECVKLGTFKFTDIDNNRVNVMVPAGNYNDETEKVVRIGGIKLVQANGAEAAEYLQPVFTEYFDEGIPAYAEVVDGGYREISDTVNLVTKKTSDGTSEKISNGALTFKYAEGEAVNEALLFNDGIMDIRLVWRSNVDTEYASIKFTRDAQNSAELRIYNDKVTLVEDGDEANATVFLPYADYAKYSVANSFSFSTTDQENLSDRYKDLRIEICDAPDVENGKVLKVYIANRSQNAVPIAMGIIPADSCLIAADDAAADNSITFSSTNSHTNGFDIGRISVSRPAAASVTEGYSVAKDGDITITETEKGKTVTAKVVAQHPFARSAAPQLTIEYTQTTPILAVYGADGALCADVQFMTRSVLKGDRAVFDYSVEVDSSVDVDKAKLFIWDNMKNLAPLKEADVKDFD